MAPDSSAEAGQGTQEHNIIAIETALGEDALLLTELEGEEALSRCFTYVARFITRASDDDVQGLLGKAATLWLNNNDAELRRPINGRIRRITEIPTEAQARGYAGYEAEIVPALWFLDLTADCRIFMGKTVPEIVKTVLSDFGIKDFSVHLLKTDYPKLDYCVQYRESALAFISRLLEEVGIFWFHQHEAQRHVLHLIDNNNLAGKFPGEPLRLAIASGQGTLESFRKDSLFRSGHWTLSDFDFEAPSKNMPQDTKADDKAMAGYETFDYPGKFTEQTVGKWLSRVRLEAEETASRCFRGAGTVAAFGPGLRVKIGPASGEAAEYLLTAVRHSARAGGYTNTQTQSSYANSFGAIPFATQFRPPRLTPKPVIAGIQTATVVSASAGDPIQTDMYGRIKVHFHWDRRGERSSGDTSCWLRVSQFNSGSHWGTISIPHAGHEVVIGFLEGDPDRPLVLGRVHNAEKMPPLNLPADKHKTVIRDHGNNRMIMRGQAGQEHLTMVSPRRVNIVAAPDPAKPLSAGVSSISAIQPFIDGTSYAEMQQIYNALNSPPSGQSATTAMAGLTSADTTPVSAGPDTGVQGDINGYAQGNMNSLCLQNMNDWVGGDYNEWVYGTGNSMFLTGNKMTVGALGKDAKNTTIVYGTNFTQVGGANITTVEGDNTSANGGAVDTLNMGAVATMTLGPSATLNICPTFTLNAGPSATVNYPVQVDMNATRIHVAETMIQNLATQIYNAGTRIDTVATRVKNVGTQVKNAQTAISNVDTRLGNALCAIESNGITVFN